MLNFNLPILIIAVILGLLQARGFAGEYAGLPLITDLSETISEDQTWAINQGPDGMMYFWANRPFVGHEGLDVLEADIRGLASAKIAYEMRAQLNGIEKMLETVPLSPPGGEEEKP